MYYVFISVKSFAKKLENYMNIFASSCPSGMNKYSLSNGIGTDRVRVCMIDHV